MYRFKNILFVPLAKRDNPAAIRRIADLAAKHDANLTVMGIVAEPSGLERLLDQPRVDKAIREAEQASLVARLEDCCRKLGDVQTNHVIKTSRSPLVIVEQVIDATHDLVVVTSDEDREDHATIKRLLRKCPVPVWVIRPTRAKTQRVLAAVNPDPQEEGLNQRILALAETMNELYGGELHLVHSWELAGEATLRSSGFIHVSPGEIEQLLESERDRHRRALDNLIDSTGLEHADWNVHLLKGSAASVIGTVLARKRINLLVMGTVARTGIAGLLVGNTAEQVLNDVRCSIIAVKPPGFEWPVSNSASDDDSIDPTL